jgi:hypothetical protein
VNLLDVGAGYGRLAHRTVQGVATIGRVLCTDAIAESTFLCEYYLKYRGVSGKASAVPLDEIERTLESTRVRIATNVHSFTECPMVAISWWLDLLAKHEVPFFFVVPNSYSTDGTRMMSAEGEGQRRDFVPEILKRGYRLAAKEPKYQVPIMQRHGVTPTDYWLFAR